MQISTASGRTDVEQVERSVVEWLRAELDDPEITAAENFLDVGGHSLIFARLNKYLGESFGTVLDQQTTYADPLSVAVAAMRPAAGHEPGNR